MRRPWASIRRQSPLQPEDASFRKALAISYEQLKQATEAAAAYEEYLRLSPSAADADKVRARIALLRRRRPAETLAQAGAPPASVPSQDR